MAVKETRPLLLIAGQAVARNLILITHNTDEFGRVTGLQIEDWEA